MVYYLNALIIQGQSIFDAASPQARSIRDLTTGYIVAAMGILLLVVALTIYICIKYRAKPGDKTPEQKTTKRKLEYVMIGVPFLLVMFFFFWSVRTMSAVLPDQGSHKPDIIITGHQWWWEAAYPGTKVVTANEIHLPVGKTILLQLKAGDVIHDWWVPALGGKMDMIPGMNNHLWITIDKPGDYEGACAEFCGQQHAWMRIKVVAQTQAGYSQWLSAHALPAIIPADTLARAGSALFMKASCASCHHIAGTVANGLEGPDLTHFASRKTMLAGLMDNTPDNVTKWITDPQKIKPGAHMPRFIFAADSIKVLTAYLTSLK